MASLFDEDLHSSDSEDDDYVPDLGEVSSEDDDGDPLPDDEIKTEAKSKKSEIPDSKSQKTLEESTSLETKVDQKQRANDLFKSFLEEVEAEMKVKEPSSSSGYAYDSSPSDSVIKSSGVSDKSSPKKSSCELFDFAGDTVAVSSEGCSKIISTAGSSLSELEKNKPVSAEKSVPDKTANQPPIMKRKGLQSVLGAIMNKKQKLTTLQKTSLDWNSFKKEHGISEELETYNKGRGGYVERQRFLQRSDVRSYEVERDLRLSKRKKSS